MQKLQYSNDALEAFRASIAASKAAFSKTNTSNTSFKKRYTFSAMGHVASIDKVYKPYFGDTSVVHDVTGETSQLDTHFGVDYIVEVSNPALKTSVDIWVQERWRTVECQKYQDMTIIECNDYSGHLAEIYKSKAQLMVYGYQTADGVIQQAIVVDFAAVLVQIALGKIQFGMRKNNKVNQTFIHVSFDALRSAGLIKFEYNKSN